MTFSIPVLRNVMLRVVSQLKDTQHNNFKPNDTQHNDTQQSDSQHYDTHYNGLIYNYRHK